MKICTNPDCLHKGEFQPLENFYKHRLHKDGYCSRCKSCEKARRHTEQGKATIKRWNSSQKGKSASNRYETSDHGRTNRQKYRNEHIEFYAQWYRIYNRSEAGKETIKRYSSRHPEVYEGHKATLRLINRGTIPHPKDACCVDCGAQATEYHHHNGYSLEHLEDVIPVCFGCHKKRHRKLPAL